MLTSSTTRQGAPINRATRVKGAEDRTIKVSRGKDRGLMVEWWHLLLRDCSGVLSRHRPFRARDITVVFTRSTRPVHCARGDIQMHIGRLGLHVGKIGMHGEMGLYAAPCLR